MVKICVPHRQKFYLCFITAMTYNDNLYLLKICFLLVYADPLEVTWCYEPTDMLSLPFHHMKPSRAVQ